MNGARRYQNVVESTFQMDFMVEILELLLFDSMLFYSVYSVYCHDWKACQIS